MLSPFPTLRHVFHFYHHCYLPLPVLESFHLPQWSMPQLVILCHMTRMRHWFSCLWLWRDPLTKKEKKKEKVKKNKHIFSLMAAIHSAIQHRCWGTGGKGSKFLQQTVSSQRKVKVEQIKKDSRIWEYIFALLHACSQQIVAGLWTSPCRKWSPFCPPCSLYLCTAHPGTGDTGE